MRNPSRRAVRAMRQAISPRLAMRTEENIKMMAAQVAGIRPGLFQSLDAKMSGVPYTFQSRQKANGLFSAETTHNPPCRSPKCAPHCGADWPLVSAGTGDAAGSAGRIGVGAAPAWVVRCRRGFAARFAAAGGAAVA